MSIPLAATSVQINSLTSFLYKHKKTFKGHQRGCPRKKVPFIWCFYTLKRSKLFFLSLGLRSPWRQTQENWWLLLSGPREDGGL